jgi:hypothetical protein
MTPRRRLVVLDPSAGSERSSFREIDDDHFHDACGVFGIFGNSEAANLTYLGLARAPAPRARVGRHRDERRATALRASLDGARPRRVHPGASREAPRKDRDRPRPLLDRRFARTSRTRSPSRSTMLAARSPSATTETSRTPTSSAQSSKARGSILPVDSDTEVSSTSSQRAPRSRSRTASPRRSRACAERTRSSS